MVYEFEKVALSGDPMPDGMTAPDQWMYLCLRNLYVAFRAQTITREKGAIEKKRLEDTYRLLQADEKLRRFRIEQAKATELAKAAYRKNRTLENADRLVAALDGLDAKEAT